MVHNSFSLKHLVELLHQRAKPDGLKVSDLFETFGTLSQSVVVLLVCVPFVQPVPLLGLSTPAGMIMMAMGASLALGIRRPWLPQIVMQKHIDYATVDKICTALEKVLEKTERFIKPRYGSWVELPLVRVLNGLLILIFAFLLALPLPVPFSNMVPAYFLIMNSAGWLERDGLVLILSYVTAIFAFAFFVGLTHGTAELIQHFWPNF